jgi:hypothetical protein
MALPSVILKLLLVALLAAWSPMCLCNLASVATDPGSCCGTVPQKGCCGSPHDEQPTGKPCKHEGACDCQKRDAYTAGVPDGYSPLAPAVLFVLTWPAAIDAPAPWTAWQAQSWVAGLVAKPQTSLLHQHCALIV